MKVVRDEVLDGTLEVATPDTIVDAKRSSKDLGDTINRGYALSYVERIAGIHTLAVPIFDFSR